MLTIKLKQRPVVTMKCTAILCVLALCVLLTSPSVEGGKGNGRGGRGRGRGGGPRAKSSSAEAVAASHEEGGSSSTSRDRGGSSSTSRDRGDSSRSAKSRRDSSSMSQNTGDSSSTSHDRIYCKPTIPCDYENRTSACIDSTSGNETCTAPSSNCNDTDQTSYMFCSCGADTDCKSGICYVPTNGFLGDGIGFCVPDDEQCDDADDTKICPYWGCSSKSTSGDSSRSAKSKRDSSMSQDTRDSSSMLQNTRDSSSMLQNTRDSSSMLQNTGDSSSTSHDRICCKPTIPCKYENRTSACINSTSGNETCTAPSSNCNDTDQTSYMFCSCDAATDCKSGICYVPANGFLGDGIGFCADVGQCNVADDANICPYWGSSCKAGWKQPTTTTTETPPEAP